MKRFATASLTSLLLSAGAALAGPPPGFRPPEEAFKACEGANEGDSCSVTLPNGPQVQGTCIKLPEQAKEDAGRLVCAPAHPPPRP